METEQKRLQFLKTLDPMEYMLYDIKRGAYAQEHRNKKLPYKDIDAERYAAKHIILLRKYGFSLQGIEEAKKLKDYLKCITTKEAS